MAADGGPQPTDPLAGAQPDKPTHRDAAAEAADRAVLAGAPPDHAEADRVAALTATPQEAAIDARMGLRGSPGRAPRPEDFAEVLTEEGSAGGVLGADISDSPFVYGEDGSTRVP